MRDLSDGVQIADTGGGVSRRLHMDESGVGTNRSADGLGIGGVQQSDLDVVLLGQVFPEQQVGGAVTDLGDNGVIAGVEEGGKHGCQSSHAAGKDRAVLRAGQGAELLLQHHLVDVAVALIDVAVNTAPVHGRSVGGDSVVGGHIDGLVDSAEGIVPAGSAVDRSGLGMQCMFHVVSPFITLFCFRTFSFLLTE